MPPKRPVCIVNEKLFVFFKHMVIYSFSKIKAEGYLAK